MNKAYETMRNFWLDVKNLQHKEEVPLLGERKICVCGVEIAARDTKGGIKNFLIAASSLGNASIYFENNSASGIGGFTGGASSGSVREKALRMMQAGAAAAVRLEPKAVLTPQQNENKVTLFAVSGDGQIYASELPETDVRNPENALYAFFAYSQQLISAFRAENEAVSPSKETAKPAAPSAAAETEPDKKQ